MHFSFFFFFPKDTCLRNTILRYNKSERKQSKKVLECVENKLLTQMMSETAKEGTLLDLLFVNGKEWWITLGGHPDNNKHL